MAEAQPIQATANQLPQKLAEAIGQRLQEAANTRAANSESARKDRLVQSQRTKRIDQRFSPHSPSSVRPLDSAQISETEMNPQTRPIKERRQEEQRRLEQQVLNRQNTRQQMKQYHENPLIVAPLIDQPRKTEHDVREIMKSYASQYEAAPENSRIRAKIREEVGKKVQKLVAKDLEGYLGKKAGKWLTKWIWRSGSTGTVIEWEGITAWVVSIIGFCVWGIRAMVTIFNPQSPRWLKMAAFDLKDPVTWAVDLPYGIIAMLFLVAMFVLIHAILLIIGAFLASLGFLADYFGFIDFF